MNSQSRRLLLLLLFASAVAAMLLLVFRNNVRAILLIPLLYVAWLGGLIFRSLHQGVYWALMLVVVAVLLAKSLQRRPGKMPHVNRAVVPSQRNRRVAYWARQIERNEDEALQEARALNGLGQLIISVYAFRANRSPWEIEEEIKAGRLALPPDLAHFFQREDGRKRTGAAEGLEAKLSSADAPPNRRAVGPLAWGRRVWWRVRSLLTGDGLPRGRGTMAPHEQHVYSMIQSLEDQLEGRGDHHDQKGS